MLEWVIIVLVVFDIVELLVIYWIVDSLLQRGWW